MYFVKFRAALRGKCGKLKNHGFEIRSLPNLLTATLRGFTFYLAVPISFADVTDADGLGRKQWTRMNTN